MESLVTAVLLATPPQADAPGWAAVRYTIAPGWHIYWENPGESGIPTTAEVTAPEGFRLGAPAYPGPERFAMPGDLVNYGYADEVALLFPLTAPATLPSDASLTATTRWLVCREDQCVPGSAALSLPLSEATADVTPWLAALPADLPAAASVVRSETAITLTWSGVGAAEVFPNPEAEAVISSATPTTDTLTFALSSPPPAGAEVVLHLPDGAYHRLPLTAP